jgi:hypothetical protein
MADAQEHEEMRKREEWREAMFMKRSKEEDWYPNQEKYHLSGWNVGDYFASPRWDTNEISKHIHIAVASYKFLLPHSSV